MEYHRLPIYEGKETYCHNCGRRFLMGAIIGVACDGTTYCLTGGCLAGEAIQIYNAVDKNFCRPMRFGDIEKIEYPRFNSLYASRTHSIFEEIMKKLYGEEVNKEKFILPK